METPAGIMVACRGVRYECLPDRFYLNEAGQNCLTEGIGDTPGDAKDCSRQALGTASSFRNSSSSFCCSSSDGSNCSNNTSSSSTVKGGSDDAAPRTHCSSSSNECNKSSRCSGGNMYSSNSSSRTHSSGLNRSDLEYDDGSCEGNDVPSPYFSRAALVEAVVASGTLQAAILQTYCLSIAGLAKEFAPLFRFVEPARQTPVLVLHGDQDASIQAQPRDAKDKRTFRRRYRRVAAPPTDSDSDTSEDEEDEGEASGDCEVQLRARNTRHVNSSKSKRANFSGSHTSKENGPSMADQSRQRRRRKKQRSRTDDEEVALPSTVVLTEIRPTIWQKEEKKNCWSSKFHHRHGSYGSSSSSGGGHTGWVASLGVHHPKLLLLCTTTHLIVVVSTANISAGPPGHHFTEGSWVQAFPRFPLQSELPCLMHPLSSNTVSPQRVQTSSSTKGTESNQNVEEMVEQSDFGVALFDLLRRQGREYTSRFSSYDDDGAGEAKAAFLRKMGGPVEWLLDKGGAYHATFSGGSESAGKAQTQDEPAVRTHRCLLERWLAAFDFQVACVDLVTTVPGEFASPSSSFVASQQHFGSALADEHVHVKCPCGSLECPGINEIGPKSRQRSKPWIPLQYGQYRVAQLLERPVRSSSNSCAPRQSTEQVHIAGCDGADARTTADSSVSKSRDAFGSHEHDNDSGDELIIQQTSLGARITPSFITSFAGRLLRSDTHNKNSGKTYCVSDGNSECAADQNDSAVPATADAVPAPGSADVPVTSGADLSRQLRTSPGLNIRLDGNNNNNNKERSRSFWGRVKLLWSSASTCAASPSGSASFFTPKGYHDLGIEGRACLHQYQHRQWPLFASQQPHMKTYARVLKRRRRCYPTRNQPSQRGCSASQGNDYLTSDDDDDGNSNDDDDDNEGRLETRANKGPSEQLAWLWLTSACLSEGAQGLEIVAPPRPLSLSPHKSRLRGAPAAAPRHFHGGAEQPVSSDLCSTSRFGVSGKSNDDAEIHSDDDGDADNISENENEPACSRIAAATGTRKRKHCAQGLAGSWSGALESYGLVEDTDDDDEDEMGAADTKRSMSAPPLSSPKACLSSSPSANPSAPSSTPVTCPSSSSAPSATTKEIDDSCTWYRCRNFEVGVLFRSTHGRRYFAARQPQDVLGPPPRSSSSQPSPQKPLANRCRPAVPPDSSTCLEAPQNEDEEDELAEWIALPLPYALTDLTPFDGPRCKQPVAPYFHDRLGLHAYAVTRPFLNELAPRKLSKAQQLWQQVLVEVAKKSTPAAAAAADGDDGDEVGCRARGTGGAATVSQNVTAVVVSAASTGAISSRISPMTSPILAPLSNPAERTFLPPALSNAQSRRLESSIVAASDGLPLPLSPSSTSATAAPRVAPVACPDVVSSVAKIEEAAMEHAPSDGTLTEGSSSDGTLSDGASDDDVGGDDEHDENCSSSGNSSGSSEGWSPEVINSAMWMKHGKFDAGTFAASAELQF